MSTVTAHSMIIFDQYLRFTTNGEQFMTFVSILYRNVAVVVKASMIVVVVLVEVFVIVVVMIVVVVAVVVIVRSLTSGIPHTSLSF